MSRPGYFIDEIELEKYGSIKKNIKPFLLKIGKLKNISDYIVIIFWIFIIFYIGFSIGKEMKPESLTPLQNTNENYQPNTSNGK